MNTKPTDQENNNASTDTNKSGNFLMATLYNTLHDYKSTDVAAFPDFEGFNLQDLINQIILSEESIRPNKNVELLLTIDDDVTLNLQGDGHRLAQVIRNLLNNAFKYTPHGMVYIHIEQIDASQEAVQIKVTVKDTGPGIEKANLNDLSARGNRPGIGLAVCKDFITLMKGVMGMESIPGEGSTFWIAVLFTKQAVQPNNPTIQMPSATRILIVEHNPHLRFELKKEMLKRGLTVSTCENGFEALRKLCLGVAEGRPYSIAIVDDNAHSDEEFDLANEIQRNLLLKNIRLVMLASGEKKADDSDDDKSGGRVLSKPFSIQNLVMAVQEEVLFAWNKGLKGLLASQSKAAQWGYSLRS